MQYDRQPGSPLRKASHPFGHALSNQGLMKMEHFLPQVRAARRLGRRERHHRIFRICAPRSAQHPQGVGRLLTP